MSQCRPAYPIIGIDARAGTIFIPSRARIRGIHSRNRCLHARLHRFDGHGMVLGVFFRVKPLDIGFSQSKRGTPSGRPHVVTHRNLQNPVFASTLQGRISPSCQTVTLDDRAACGSSEGAGGGRSCVFAVDCACRRYLRTVSSPQDCPAPRLDQTPIWPIHPDRAHLFQPP